MISESQSLNIVSSTRIDIKEMISQTNCVQDTKKIAYRNLIKKISQIHMHIIMYKCHVWIIQNLEIWDEISAWSNKILDYDDNDSSNNNNNYR